jgi:flagellar hook assembly protein FlgD
VRLRFRLVTDNSVDDPGWWIGEMKITSATEVEEEEDNLVAQTIMKASYPNPFLFTGSRASASRIEFSLAEAGEAQLSVYNLKGQKVKNLIDEYMSAGQHFTSWDGTNNQGEITGSGVYFYQLKTESKIINRKMILIK